MSYVIGVDVGGTNTDVVIMDGNHVIGWNKSATSENIMEGVVTSVVKAIENTELNGYENVQSKIVRVSIGTTHFINAVIKRTGLSKVACIRICGILSQSLPPFVDFPPELEEKINGGCYLVNGGFEFDGRVITEINEEELVEAIKNIKKDGIRHVAICGIFSPINGSQEEFVRELLQKHAPDVTCSVSQELGNLGLLERENATILNESLKNLCEETISGFHASFRGLGLKCPVFFTQNDGTLISEKQILDFPVFTFSSGATNSMRGAAYLSASKDAIVVDIGGTSTDVGVLVNGFPREASTRVKVAGVNTNFRMPDTVSIGLGGGSIVRKNSEAPNDVFVGPESVEYKLKEKALVFGGDIMVATDIAVANGNVSLGSKENLSNLTNDFTRRTMDVIRQMVEDAVDSVKLSHELYPIVLVGGGSILIDHEAPFKGASKVCKPDFYQVANAVGAALSQVSGMFDKLIDIPSEDARIAAIQCAKNHAIEEAVKSGACRDTCTILDVTEIQMSYVAVPRTRLRVKAAGDLLLERTNAVTLETDQKIISENSNEQKFIADTRDTDQSFESTETIQDMKSLQNTTTQVQQKKISEYKPNVNEAGEWLVNSFDVECLTIGAGILGCGGGGSPYLARLELLKCIEEGGRPRIINPNSFQGTAFCIAYMGAPEILYERLTTKNELSTVLHESLNLARLGFIPGLNEDEIKEIAKKNDLELKSFGKYTLVENIRKEKLAENPDAILVAEIGGMNSLGPLTVGSRLNVPILDCDGMGRAFPQLQHFTPFIYGKPAYPAVLSNNHGKTVCCVQTETAFDLETFFREECVKSGCAAAVCISMSKKEEILSTMCQNTLTKAWRIGLAVLDARQQHFNPLQAIVDECQGQCLVSGKISSLKKETKEGFTKGKISIEGCGEKKGQSVEVDFQNEYIVARTKAGDLLACTPDLITLVETDTGEPIQTSELKYGIRASLLVFPAPPLMTTEQALKYVGPSAFGYHDVTYKSCGAYSEVKSNTR